MEPDDVPHDCYRVVKWRFMVELEVVLVARLEYDWLLIRSILEAMDDDDLSRAA